jgi:hypothetical protein
MTLSLKRGYLSLYDQGVSLCRVSCARVETPAHQEHPNSLHKRSILECNAFINSAYLDRNRLAQHCAALDVL